MQKVFVSKKRWLHFRPRDSLRTSCWRIRNNTKHIRSTYEMLYETNMCKFEKHTKYIRKTIRNTKYEIKSTWVVHFCLSCVHIRNEIRNDLRKNEMKLTNTKKSSIMDSSHKKSSIMDSSHNCTTPSPPILTDLWVHYFMALKEQCAMSSLM